MLGILDVAHATPDATHISGWQHAEDDDTVEAGRRRPMRASLLPGKFGSKTADSQELSFHSCDARDGLDYNGRAEHLQGRRLGLTVDVVNRDLCWKV